MTEYPLIQQFIIRGNDHEWARYRRELAESKKRKTSFKKKKPIQLTFFKRK